MRATSKTAERSHRVSFGARMLAVAGAVAAAGFVLAVFLGSPAQANPRGPAQASASTLCTSGVPDAYKTFATIAGCSTTTTVAPSSSFTLTVSYNAGTVTWRACGSQSLAGTTVQLYIDGQAMTGRNGTATVNSNGCTDPDMQMCLAPGSHTATAVDGPNQASKSFTVSNSGCSNPQLLSGSGGLGAHAGGPLAFTGTDVVLMLVAAALLIALGLAAVRLAKQRR